MSASCRCATLHEVSSRRNLSPKLVQLLGRDGHDVVHVRDIGLVSASDEVVIAAASADDRILISADTDFGTLLARSHADRPSFVLIRRASGRWAIDQAALIIDNLVAVKTDLEVGAIVVLGDSTVRIRRLPIGE